MPWGSDDWLLDAAGRKRWMRSIALMGLGEQILRTQATATEGLGCLLDEVLGAPKTLPKLRLAVAADLARAKRWMIRLLGAARVAVPDFQSIALVLTDGAPYQLSFAAVRGSVSLHEDWIDREAWRSSATLAMTVLDAGLPRFTTRDAAHAAELDYIVPISYSAFLIREVFCARKMANWQPATTAILSYSGGDALLVPMAKRGR